MPELAKWDSFYVIVGSAAGALIGLQFVVMTLIANEPRVALREGLPFRLRQCFSGTIPRCSWSVQPP